MRELPAEMMEMSPGTAVARHGGSSITLWRGAADAVTVMVRGDDLERLLRGADACRGGGVSTRIVLVGAAFGALVALLRR